MSKLKNKYALIAIIGILLVSLNLMTAAKATVNRASPRGSLDENFYFEILAGQHIPVGFLEIWSDPGYVYVKYSTYDNWYLTETHLHLARDWRDIPQTKTGNPIPGHFAYQMEHDFVNVYTYQIPRIEWKFGAAHCIVVKIENGKPVQKETGWARNKVPPYGEFPGRNWAWYFEMRN